MDEPTDSEPANWKVLPGVDLTIDTNEGMMWYILRSFMTQRHGRPFGYGDVTDGIDALKRYMSKTEIRNPNVIGLEGIMLALTMRGLPSDLLEAGRQAEKVGYNIIAHNMFRLSDDARGFGYDGDLYLREGNSEEAVKAYRRASSRFAIILLDNGELPFDLNVAEQFEKRASYIEGCIERGEKVPTHLIPKLDNPNTAYNFQPIVPDTPTQNPNLFQRIIKYLKH